MFDGIIYKYTCIPTGLSYVGQAIGDGSIRHSQFMSLGTRYTSGRSAIDPYAGCKSRIIAAALKRCRRVEVTCLSTGEVTVCPSITKSSEFTGVCRSSISLCCQGKRKSASGYVFRYVD